MSRRLARVTLTALLVLVAGLDLNASNVGSATHSSQSASASLMQFSSATPVVSEYPLSRSSNSRDAKGATTLAAESDFGMGNNSHIFLTSLKNCKVLLIGDRIAYAIRMSRG